MARGTGVLNEYVLGVKKATPDADKTENGGGQVIAIAGNFETEAADDAGSKYRLCNLNANLVPIQIELNCDSIADATDVDLGLYESLEHGGAVKDADILMDGTDINAGAALGSEVNCMTAVPIASIGKALFELAGDTVPTPDMTYDLVLTMNSNVSAAGTIAIRGLFAKQA